MIRVLGVVAALVLWCPPTNAQTGSASGFVEGRGFLFPQTAVNDSTRGVADALYRQDGLLRAAPWLQLAATFDLRANSHGQVENAWRLDWQDRHVRRARASIRRLTATLTTGRFTLDVGKQFIRWARADVLNPIDRFAPRDFLNVIDSEFLAVTGARASLQVGPETFEAVWVPQLTPSRMPLLTQRWTVVPPGAGLSFVDAGSRFPKRAQGGARWRHTGSVFEAGVSYFDGFNHFPAIELTPLEDVGAVALTRVFPRLRTYGADMAIPTQWLTFKAEAAYFISPADAFAEYALYVAEIERQVGEWMLTAGYAGTVVTRSSIPLAFDPERSLARSFIARASYVVDPRRTVAVEAVARQNGDGYYLKAEYSQALGDYYRVTVTPVLLGGDQHDFLGQYTRNSHVSLALRASF